MDKLTELTTIISEKEFNKIDLILLKSLLRADFINDNSKKNNYVDSDFTEELKSYVGQISAANVTSTIESEKLILAKVLELLGEYIKYVEYIRENSHNLFSRSSKRNQIYNEGFYSNIKDRLVHHNDSSTQFNQVTLIGEIFYTNILLFYLDEVLECSDFPSSELGKIIHKLSAYETREYENTYSNVYPFFKGTIDKARFLQHKIYFRDWVRERKRLLSSDATVEVEEFEDPTFYNQSFSDKWTEIKNHYNILTKKSAAKLKKSVSQNFDKVSDFHHFSKYLKRTESLSFAEKKEEIEELIQKARDINLECYYTKYSLQNILSATKLTIKLEEERNKFDYQNVLEEFISSKNGSVGFLTDCENIIKLKVEEEDFFIDNMSDYHAHFKLLVFVEDFLNYLRKNSNIWLSSIYDRRNEEVQDKNRVDDIVKKESDKLNWIKSFYQRLYIKAFDNLKLNAKFKLLPIYLETKTCRFEIDSNNKSEIYVDSGYVLPSSFIGFDLEWIAKETIIDSLVRSLRNRIEIDLQLIAFNLTKDDFDKRVKENEFKSIQIIALFVSVTVFALGTLRIIEGKNLFESLSIVSLMAGGLTLFNAFFRWLVIAQIRRPIYYGSFESFWKNVSSFPKVGTSWKYILIYGILYCIINAVFFSPNLNITAKIIGASSLVIFGIYFKTIVQILFKFFSSVFQPHTIYSFLMMAIIVGFVYLSFEFMNRNTAHEDEKIININNRIDSLELELKPRIIIE